MAEKRVFDAELRPWPSTRQLAAGACSVLLVLLVSVHLDIWREGVRNALGSRPGGGGRPWRRGGGGGPLPSAGHASSMPMASPSRTMYYAMLANPQLLETDRGLLEEFEAAPWLLPPRTTALPYAGVHGFDKLAALRATAEPGADRAVTILLFSKAYAVMMQNSIYSLVKHGGVRNYIAVTWFEHDFEACLDLNLPCANVAHMLVEPLRATHKLLQHDFVVMTWIKPAVVLQALRQGYTVLMADTDVAYTVKPLWESYLEYMDRNEADGAWQAESPLNSGHFVLRPTPAALRFAEAWNASAADNVPTLTSEQKALPQFQDTHFVTCRSPCLCYKQKFKLLDEGRRDDVAVFAVYFPGIFMYTQAGCTVGSPEWVPDVDPCDWSVLFMHPICAGGKELKQTILTQAGFWFTDTKTCAPREGTASEVPVCHPLHWRQPDAEARLYSCGSFDLGLVHGKMPVAVAALRAGLAGDDAMRLLFASRDKECWPDNAEVQQLRPAWRR